MLLVVGRGIAVKFLSYAIGIVIQPSKTVSALISASDAFKVGLLSVLTLGVLYATTAFLLYARGFSAAAPVLALPSTRYYLYQGFFNLPVSLAIWLLMGGTIYLLAPRNEVTFQRFLGAIGLPYGILVLPLMWLPETIVVIGWPSVWTSSLWVGLTPVRVVLGTLWVYLGCTLSVKKVYDLSWIRAARITFVGLIVGLTLSFVFIR